MAARQDQEGGPELERRDTSPPPCGCRRRARTRRTPALPNTPRRSRSSDPEPVRARRLRSRAGPGRAGAGRAGGRACSAPRPAAALGALDPVGSHQPLDGERGARSRRCAAPSRCAGNRRRSSSPRAPADPRQQPPVLDRRAERLPCLLVVGGRRHAQSPADRLDPETAAILIDVARSLRSVCRARGRKSARPP